MNRTDKVVDGLVQYIKGHPNEPKELVDIINDIAESLGSGKRTLIEMSNYIKKLPQPYNIAVHMIFTDVYRKAEK